MKINRTGIVTIFLMLIVLLAGGLYTFFFVDESEIQKRDNTPAAQALLIEDQSNSFTNLNGETVSVSDNFGKIIIVTSWASWCPQCVESLNRLGQIATDYKDKDVVVLAINRAEDRYSVERYLNTITVPQDLQIILDPSDHYFASSAGYAMPETILYTKGGQEDVHQRGDLNADEIRQHLNELLK